MHVVRHRRRDLRGHGRSHHHPRQHDGRNEADEDGAANDEEDDSEADEKHNNQHVQLIGCTATGDAELQDLHRVGERADGNGRTIA